MGGWVKKYTRLSIFEVPPNTWQKPYVLMHTLGF